MDSIQSEKRSELISLIDVSENEAENGNNDHLISLINMSESVEEENESNKNNFMCDRIKLNFYRVVRNWRKCLACGERKKLHRPSLQMRRYFCTQKVYIQKNDRVCDFHFRSENWPEIRFKKTSIFSSKVVDEMLSFLMKTSPHEYPKFNIGLTGLELKEVLRELKIPDNANKKQMKITKAVQLFLERLHTGHTYEQMGQRHNMNRRAIGVMIKRGRKILLENFVRNHIGYEIRTHEWLTNHTTDLARLLYCNNDQSKCVAIIDGTYIYTCNTRNYSHQRMIYSCQKHRRLFKIMKITAVDGSIIDVFGPFPAVMNDAAIIKKVFEETTFGQIFNAGDVILVDRGFRDCEKFLKNRDLTVKMPEFIKRGNKGQLTTNQANKSRLVTKMRFAIEAANGRMKSKWFLFNKIIPSILTVHLMSDYKIGSALINAFAKPIICDKNDKSIGN